LKDLEHQLNKLKLEREANNIFGSEPDSGLLSNYLEKNESDTKYSNFKEDTELDKKRIQADKSTTENKTNHDDDEKPKKTNHELIQDKLDYLFSSQILNPLQKGFICKIENWDLKEKIGK